jgi:hypothetical protein
MFMKVPAKALLILFASVGVAQVNDDKLAAVLRVKDQQLLNAVHRGDRRTWEDTTTDDFLYIEDGEIQPRDVFLEELDEDGLAPLVIRSFEVHQVGDTALVLHRDDVPQRPMRDERNSHFLFSETWQRIGDTWKLRRVDITRLRIDPPAIPLTHSQIDELTGSYTDGTTMCTIRRDGDHIFVHLPGRPEKELKAETRDVLFAPGEVRSRKVFLRGSDGQVKGFADRDQSSETYWTRRAPLH